MTEIFLSYAREDWEQAERLAKALENRGCSVFWDRIIPAGKTWHENIESALEEANCVLVAWSNASVRSPWVREEADEGRERGILIPVFFEKVRPPFGYRGLQAEDLSEWDGSDDFHAWQRLVSTISAALGRPLTQREVSCEDLQRTEQKRPPTKQKNAPRKKRVRQPSEPGTVFRDTLKDGAQVFSRPLRLVTKT